GRVLKSEVVTLADAVAFYTDKICANDKDAWGWSERGIAWGYKGDVDKAIKDFSEAIRLSPDASSFFLRGFAWLTRDEFRKALADLNNAVRLDPKDAAALK